MSEVLYRDIDGCPGYRVGSDGSVWSRRRLFRRGLSDQWRRLKGCARKGDGYILHCLYPIPGGPKKYKYAHRLVLEVFFGPCPPGMEACHNDGNPSNNRLENLRWDTSRENNADLVRHGTLAHGSRCPWSKLRDEDIPAVFRLRAEGMTFQAIADRFGVSESQIRRIIRGRRWCHAAALHMAALRQAIGG